MPRAKRKSAVASAKSEVEADAAASSHHQHHQQDGPSSSTLDASASNLAGYYVPAVAPSDVSTSGDEDDEAWITNDGGDADTTSNVQPPAPAQSDDDDDDEGPSGAASSGAKNKKEATCRWNDCGQVFADMIKFIDHLHNTHVGNSRNKYACEWTGCSRRGKPQTSRFALLSHLRSHTGEKPFTCPRPDCDKSFTRSDALSKHMRVQHDIMPAPARGGRLSAAALAERAAAEKGGQEGGRSGGAGTRSSARRSALAAAVNNNDAVSLDEELLGLAEGGAAAVSTAAQIAANADAMPGDPLHWTYEAMFPHEEGNDAQQQTQPQQQQATTQSFASGVGGGGSSMITQPQQTATGSSRFTDEELGIERFSSIRKRIPLSWVDGTLEDWNPTAGALAAAVDTSNKPELQYSRDDQAAEAEAVLVLEKARRQWVQEMAKRQEAESKEPGGSGGAFVGNWHAIQGSGKSGGVDTPADGAAGARPSSSAGGAFYDSDSDMSDIEPTGGEEAASVPAPAPAAAAPSPFAAPAAREAAAASAGTPTSSRPKRQTRPPASRHLDDGSDAGGEADASSSKMQVDDNGPAAGASSKAFDEESVLSSPPSSPPPSAPSAMDLSAMTTPVPHPPPVAATTRRPQATAPPSRGGGGDSSSNRTLLSTLIRAHLVESAKLSIAQAENRRLVADLEGCLVELRDLMWEKKRVLEAVLEMELGADVKAIFDPAGDGEDGQQDEEHHHHNGQEDETMGEVDGMPHHDGMASFGVGDGASAVAAAAAALQHHAQQQEQRAYG